METKKRRNKTFEQQAKFYGVDDFKHYILEQWILGNEIGDLYLELSKSERINFLAWLLYEEPYKDWKEIVLYLIYYKHNFKR